MRNSTWHSLEEAKMAMIFIHAFNSKMYSVGDAASSPLVKIIFFRQKTPFFPHLLLLPFSAIRALYNKV